MKIYSSNYNTPPQFKSKFIERIKSSANLKKPLEKMTIEDVENLMGYIQGLKYRMGISPQEIKEILSKDGIDFINQASKFLISKLGFTTNNAPPIYFIKDSIGGGGAAAYVCHHNIVYIAEGYENYTKSQLFALLRHEFQHAIQNHNIFRTEGLGEEAVEFYTERSFDEQKKYLLDFAQNYSIKELLTQGLIDNNGAILISELSNALQKNDTKEVENIFNKIKESIKIELNEFRKKLIREQGLIKSDSKAAKIAKEHFEEFKSPGYFDKDGNIDWGKHCLKEIEIEANTAQIMAEAEINQTCFIRQAKINLEKLCKNENFMSSINKQFTKGDS